jgi:hypothetical protein
MYTLILDHKYDRPKPAVDHSAFAQHGVCENTSFNANSSDGSGEMLFAQNNARIHIQKTQIWDRMSAITISVRLRLSASNNSRRNVIEGDNSFALYIDGMGAVHFDVLAVVSGNPSLAWIPLVSPAGLVTPNKWITIKAQHNGLSHAKIVVDDQVVASRNDYVSPISLIGAEGVSIGNWTLAPQYPLLGSVSKLRVWKYDPLSSMRDFSRRLTDDQGVAWGDIFDCLTKDEGAHSLRRAIEELVNLFRDIVEKMRTADESLRAEMRIAIQNYRVAWAKGALSSDKFTESLDTIASLLLKLDDAVLLDRLRRITATLNEFTETRNECLRNVNLVDRDPTWIKAIQKVGTFSSQKKLRGQT